MFKKFKKMISKVKYETKNTIQNLIKDEEIIEVIPSSIEEVKKKLEGILTDCSDFIIREINFGIKKNVLMVICYVDGLVDKDKIEGYILKPLMLDVRSAKMDEEIDNDDLISLLPKRILTAGDITLTKDFKTSVDNMLTGDAIVFIDGYDTAIKVAARGYEKRGVEEPQTENVIRGPREGFTENLRTNTSLLRRKIKTPKLKFESFIIGEQTKTVVEICYIKGIADENIIETVRRRIRKIDTDGILESGYVEEFIEDAPHSIFPTVGKTEKPDIVAGKILEGRVAIITEGTPFVLTVPYLFVENIMSSEDYYVKPTYATVSRMFRFLALIIAAALPAFYIALISFHFNVLPFQLVITIAAAREGIPFAPFTEAFIMGIAFELLREAGVRMPGQVGSAVSIVGALVLGEAAIQAGLTSPTMVIVVAATAISSFILPSLLEVLPIVRILLLIASNILGLLGIVLAMVAMFVHVCTLRSFGVPYMSPHAPLNIMDLKDTLVRAPLWMMVTRPRAIVWDNKNQRYRMKIDYRKKED